MRVTLCRTRYLVARVALTHHLVTINSHERKSYDKWISEKSLSCPCGNVLLPDGFADSCLGRDDVRGKSRCKTTRLLVGSMDRFVARLPQKRPQQGVLVSGQML